MSQTELARKPSNLHYVGKRAGKKGPYSAREIPLEELTPKRISNFHKKVVRTSTCHIWRGSNTGHISHPYGTFRVGGSAFVAHRVAWVIEHSSNIPSDRVIDHMCGLTLCVNPAHMRLVTQAENIESGLLVRDPIDGTYRTAKVHT